MIDFTFRLISSPFTCFSARIVHGVGNEHRLAALHRALELGVALEIDDVVADRGVLVGRHQPHRTCPPRSARKIEQRSSPNASPSLRAIDLQNVDEVERARDLLENLDHGEQVLALALQLADARGEPLRFGGGGG